MSCCKYCINARRIYNEKEIDNWVACSKHKLEDFQRNKINYTGTKIAEGWSYVRVWPIRKPSKAGTVDEHVITPQFVLVEAEARCDFFEPIPISEL